MPIKVQSNLPAIKVLESENIFVMPNEVALRQDIRPLKIGILNLMPTKVATETQILRCLSNTPLQIEVTLVQTSTHTSKNTSSEHLLNFYKTFDEVKNNRYDGMIITGAPVETMDFEQVDYWPELCEIMDFSETNVYSTLHVCWGAQAGLYYHYGIRKELLPAKMFGVFRHTLREPYVPIFRGFDDEFYVPHSRHTEIRREDVMKVPDLTLLSESEESGVYMAMARGGREFFITGHSEYSPYTLNDEYMRDVNKGLPIAVPRNYYRNNNPALGPVVRWRGHANLLFTNWLNYYVYQETPFRIEDISKLGDL